MKTVIYLDVLLLVNFLIAYPLLSAAGSLSGQRASFGRLLGACVLAALSSLILFAPELPYGFQLLYKVMTAALITAAAYGLRQWRRFAAAAAWYAALNMLLAGFALLYVFQTRSKLVEAANLTLYLRVPPLLLVTMVALCYLAIQAVQRLLTPAEPPPAVAGLMLDICGTPVQLRAVLDTGCHLKDPMTCMPVLLISYPDAQSRLPAEAVTFLRDWFAGADASRPPDGLHLRLIPCETASGSTLLPGFALERMALITRQGPMGLGRGVVAFSAHSLGASAYEALYGQDFLPLHSHL